MGFLRFAVLLCWAELQTAAEPPAGHPWRHPGFGPIQASVGQVVKGGGVGSLAFDRAIGRLHFHAITTKRDVVGG